MEKRALVVDDEDLLRELMTEALVATGWRVEATGDLAEARRLATASPFDVAIIDVNLGGAGTGLDLCRDLAPSLPVVLTSGLSEEAEAGALAGARAFVPKPFMPRDLVNAVEAAVGPTT